MTMLYRLRGLREDRDLSQEEMAAILNISQSSYSDYELEKTNIPIISLRRLAKYFNTSVDYILGLTDDPRPYPRSRNILWQQRREFPKRYGRDFRQHPEIDAGQVKPCRKLGLGRTDYRNSAKQNHKFSGDSQGGQAPLEGAFGTFPTREKYIPYIMSNQTIFQ